MYCWGESYYMVPQLRGAEASLMTSYALDALPLYCHHFCHHRQMWSSRLYFHIRVKAKVTLMRHRPPKISDLRRPLQAISRTAIKHVSRECLIVDNQCFLIRFFRTHSTSCQAHLLLFP